jgi:protein involved in sex pheromone biosynthesis
MKQLFVAFVILSLIFNGCKKDDNGNDNDDKITSAEDLKINQMQVIASHNSYRKKTYQPIFDFLLTLNILPENLSPTSWDYEHLPFDE